MKATHRLDYVLQPEVQKMLGHFSSLLNVRIGFFSLEGREVCVGLGRPVCTYCQLVRGKFQMDDQCWELDQRMFEQARRKGRPVRYSCHANLTEIILPVQLAERCIGFIMVGQFRTSEQTPATLTKVWNRPSQAAELRQHYAETPVFSNQQVDDMIHMLRLVVQFITDHYLVSMPDFDVIQPLIEQIEAHPEQTLTLKEAAALIGRSPSSLSHLFKHLTGSSVRQFQIARRIEEADRLLQTFPQMPVKEVAERTGFEDPLYFSRLYRQHRGHSPSAKRVSVS